MQLLVSVDSAAEAMAAIQGGADLIDAKNPRAGALGAVSVETLEEIHATVDGERRVTAALGDATEETTTEHLARAFTRAGAEFVKVGFAGITSAERARALTGAAKRGAREGRDGTGVVVVAYADWDHVASLAPSTLCEVAANAGVEGLLIDTADKDGPGLRRLIAPPTLAGWVDEAHKAGLFVALAGKLAPDDLEFVRDAGADIAGVRGAACDGGRIGRVVAERVRLLRERCVLPVAL